LIPVALGLGISIWQVFGAEQGWLVACACAGAALLGLSIGPSSRLKGLMHISALLLGLGFGAITQIGLRRGTFRKAMDRQAAGVSKA
jgi:hypothetical protein